MTEDPSKTEPPRLLDRVRDAIRVRHLSRRTEEAYTQWIRRYVLFHQKRHPADMGEREINAFLTHLAVEKRVSPSTQTQALCALLFLYRIVLERDIGELDLIRAKRRRRLPVVLTRDEVRTILCGTTCGTCASFIGKTSKRGTVGSICPMRSRPNIRERRANGDGNTSFRRRSGPSIPRAAGLGATI